MCLMFFERRCQPGIADLAGQDVNQVPVVQNGHLVGMRRRRDILRWLQDHSKEAAS